MAGTSKSKTAAALGSAKPVSNPLARIQTLETACTSSTYDPNPLIPLLALSRHASPEVVHKAIWALHRVFVRYVNEGRVGGIVDGLVVRGARESGEDGLGAGEVKGWVRDRLLEYIEILGGLLRDSESALRNSALPLLYSLLAPLSATVSPPEKPVVHTPYFRLVLRYLLSPIPTLRGAKPTSEASTSSGVSGKWEVVEDHQVDEAEGVLPSDMVHEIQSEYWAKNDDLRWAFFKEATHLIQNEPTILAHSENLLGQLLPLTNLPKLQDDLNTFFISSFSIPPNSTSTGNGTTSKKSKATEGTKKKRTRKSGNEIDALPDWMATYDSSSSGEEDKETTGPRKRQRTTALSVHASIYSVPSHQSLYTTLWEVVVGSVRLDDAQTRRTLVALHGERGILGHMRSDRRVRVADWLGSLVDRGGAKAMLAMNGLFVLMTKYNLDYPDFYKRLYALLDCNVLHVRYRARFFRLLDTFLSSTLLPAALVASFIKRLSRLALTAPPAGIIIVIPFVYNLFKRHPGTMTMIQRHDDGSEDTSNDLYDGNDPSPLTSKAINSSCWELASLQHHYLTSVSTLAKVFTEVFTKPEYNMEDFLDHGYDTLFATETNRKIKDPPSLSMILEGGGDVPELFPRTKVSEGGDEDIVARLWTF